MDPPRYLLHRCWRRSIAPRRRANKAERNAPPQMHHAVTVNPCLPRHRREEGHPCAPSSLCHGREVSNHYAVALMKRRESAATTLYPSLPHTGIGRKHRTKTMLFPFFQSNRKEGEHATVRCCGPSSPRHHLERRHTMALLYRSHGDCCVRRIRIYNASKPLKVMSDTLSHNSNLTYTNIYERKKKEFPENYERFVKQVFS